MMKRVSFGLVASTFAIAVSSISANADDAKTAPAYGSNIIVNGDAETELGATDSGTIVKPTGWTTTGMFTAVKYGASGGFPDATTPGPKDRGKSLFEGGNASKSTATQTISLAPFATDLASAPIPCTFSGWLGGYASQEDNAVASVTFASASGAMLGKIVLGPVTAKMRKSMTESIALTKTAMVPEGAASAMVTIVLTRVDGTYNDGSVDNLSLVLTKPQ